MENQQMGERLSVTDPAVVPDQPISPNRPLLIIGGLAAGLIAGFLLALAVELIQRPIRGMRDLQAVTGLAPLAVIPSIEKGAAGPRRSRFAWFRRARRGKQDKEKHEWTPA